MSNFSCFCRIATLNDDVEKIAKFIHLTDPYIYPKMTPKPDDELWVRFIAECLKDKNNIYYIENISVVMCDSDIIGVACIIPCNKKLTITSNIKIPKGFSEKIAPVVDGYFDPLIEESYLYSGYNIVNICVDEGHRGKGIGSLLMSYCIDKYGSQTIHLDVIASNSSAIQLYKKYGFKIEKEYIGYSGNDTLLPCYHMIRELG